MINYIFHIGERCNSYNYLNNKKLLSGVIPLNGIYISFNVAIMQIKNEFIDFIDDIIEFVISSKKEFKYVKNVPENKKELEELIIANKFNFFNSINYYKNSNYSINFKYFTR